MRLFYLDVLLRACLVAICRAASLHFIIMQHRLRLQTWQRKFRQRLF